MALSQGTQAFLTKLKIQDIRTLLHPPWYDQVRRSFICIIDVLKLPLPRGHCCSRPAKTWLSCVIKDMESCGLELSEGSVLADCCLTQVLGQLLQPGERTHFLVVPGVHFNRSVEEVLSHVSFQPQSISRIHSSFLSLLTKSNKKLEAISFSQYLLQGVPKKNWKLALNNNTYSIY